MSKNNKMVATENAQIQDLQNQVAVLKYQLKEATKIIDIYYEITRYGRYEIEDNEDFNACMIAINDGDYRERIEELDLFKEDRGQRVYIVHEKDFGWKIEYQNPNRIVVRLTPTQLFYSPYNLLDAIDDLK